MSSKPNPPFPFTDPAGIRELNWAWMDAITPLKQWQVAISRTPGPSSGPSSRNFSLSPLALKCYHHDREPPMPQFSTRLRSFTTTIANGQSLAAELDLLGDGDWLPVAILMPAAWTAAAITAKARHSPSDTAGNVNTDSAEWTLASAQAAAGAYVLLTNLPQLRARFLTLRSGTSGTPVAQGADRVLTLICRSAG
jgi:hypothetical protein